MSYNVNRIGGLASGMDIDQIVSDLMNVEQMKANRLFQQRQILEWQKQDYRDINLKLRTLYNSTFDMKLSSSYVKYTVSGITDEGNSIDTYFSATASANAAVGKHSVAVEHLAQRAEMESAMAVSAPLAGDEIVFPVEIAEGSNSFNMTVGSAKKTVVLEAGSYSSADDLRDALQGAIDDAFGADRVSVGVREGSLTLEPAVGYEKVTIAVKDVAGSELLSELGFKDGAAYSPIKVSASLMSQLGKLRSPESLENLEDGVLRFEVNGKEFSFDLGENGKTSLNDILSAISADKDVGVAARYDALRDKVVFTSEATGSQATIEIGAEGASKDFLEALGIGFQGNVAVAQGTDASVVFDGIRVERDSNKFTLEGINFDLKNVTPGEVTIEVGKDVDAAVESVKKYVELYNETIDAINKKINEDRHSDYPPLTDAQKADMKESEMKLWEEKSRTGMLKSDSMLKDLLTKMRQALYTSVEGQPEGMSNLMSIGIGTKDWREMGKLHVDEDKLRGALEKDPEAVMRLFNADGSEYGEKGVATRLYDTVKIGMDKITERAGGGEFQLVDNSVLGKQIKDMDRRIWDFDERLLRVQDRYWKQFSAMEQALLAMNQQSMWLMTQMGLDGF